MGEHLLEIKHLKKTYPVYDDSGKLFAKKKRMCAVDDLSFLTLKRGNLWSGRRIRMRKINHWAYDCRIESRR